MKTTVQPLLHDMLQEAAKKYADRTALEWHNISLSYAQLDAASNHVANCLRSSGVTTGAIVDVMIENPLDLITGLIGILKAGAAFAALDPNYPEQRLQHMVAAAPPACFLAEGKYAEKLYALGTAQEARPIFVIDDVDPTSLPRQAVPLKELVPAYDVAAEPVFLDPDGLCYIYFTSGSTGTPKAIAGRLEGLSHFIAWERRTFGVNETFRVSQIIPPSFDPFLRDIFVPLTSGATLCVPDNRETILDPKRLLQWMDERRITLMHCVPTLFRAMVNEHYPTYLPSLKYLLIAGELLFGADVKKWMDAYGEQVQLVNLYGPTETTLAKFYYLIQPADRHRQLMPVGQPIDGATAFVLDDEGNECPPTYVGEIYIQTPYRTLGYYNRPDLTNEVFIQRPFSTDPEDILYKTGDVGRVLDDGNFEVLGRKDHQVKVRGVRIELGEIEKALRDHPLIKDAVVKDWDNAQREKYLAAYFVSEAGLSNETLRAFLLRALPPAMIPAVFLRLEKLPLNPNGKIDRKALPMPDESHMVRGDDFVAPRTPIEARLAAIWAEVLDLQQVSVTENFFALGGHSLLAVRVIIRVQERFQVELSLNNFFETPTIQELSAQIEQLLIAQIDLMSDEEVELILASEGMKA
jgi:amino acid adenylation domain-containing protein